jgi:RNA polymerase sigma factor (sigma-70 family)
MNDVLRHFRSAALGGRTDRDLLECFLNRRDEAAFEAVVRRHGAMVLGVCRRVLGNHHDAEDAFQATFLVLARKAASVGSLGPWLHGVAYRTALRVRTMNARRRAHEQRAKELARPATPGDDGWQELLPLLDQELDRLPERYRVAVVLCDLEGMTRRDAARQLGVPEGTLSGRLTRARRLLAGRLARYGLVPSAGALTAALCADGASAGVMKALAASAAEAAVRVAEGRALAAGAVPARVVALTEGVMKTMFLTKLRAFVAVAFVLLVGAGTIGLTYRPAGAQQGDAPRSLVDDVEALRLEVQALRKSLDAVRERVKALEAAKGPDGAWSRKEAPPTTKFPTKGNDEARPVEKVPAKVGGEFTPSKKVPAKGGDDPALPKKVPAEPDDEAPPTKKLSPKGGDEPALPKRPPAKGEDEAGLPSKKALKDVVWSDEKWAESVTDPVAQAEAALKGIRDARDPEAYRRAADELDKALQRLKKKGGAGRPPGN